MCVLRSGLIFNCTSSYFVNFDRYMTTISSRLSRVYYTIMESASDRHGVGRRTLEKR